MPFKKGQSGNFATQFKKGQSGNPKGLPKGYKSFNRRLREVSCEKINYKDVNDKKIRATTLEALVIMILKKALFEKDLKAAEIIINNIDKDLEFAPAPEQVKNITGNPLNLSDKQVLAIAAIIDDEYLADQILITESVIVSD